MVEPQGIVAAAQQVIRERGVAHCTTREIAQVAGCSEGSIYNHFASKEELISRAVGDRLCGFPAHVRHLPEQAGTADVAANLVELARSAIVFFHHLAPLLGAMVADPDRRRAHMREVDERGQGPRWALRAVADYLRREQELGRVRADAAVDGAAQLLLGGCLQQALNAAFYDPDLLPADDDAAADAMVAAIVAGLQPGREPTS